MTPGGCTALYEALAGLVEGVDGPDGTATATIRLACYQGTRRLWCDLEDIVWWLHLTGQAAVARRLVRLVDSQVSEADGTAA